MTEFEFDIQRFASRSVSTAAELTNAISSLSASGDTITLTADIDITQSLTISSNVTAVTIDLNSHKINYTADTTNDNISISQNSYVTFKNGTITSDSGVTVTISYSQSAAPTFTGVTFGDNVSKIVTVRTAAELINAVNALDDTDTTIKLGASNISDPANFIIDKNVTIDFGYNSLGYTSDHTITIAEGVEVTFTSTGGSISPDTGVDVLIEYTNTAPTIPTGMLSDNVIVAKVVEVGTADDLTKAIAALDGTTNTIIKLTADITGASDIDIDGTQTVVFDMNSHSITYSSAGNITIGQNSTVKFKNGGSIISSGSDDTSVNIEYYQGNAPDFGNTKLTGDNISKTVSVSSYAELNAALTALDGTETTIQLTQNITNGQSLNIAANQKVTIDLSDWTYTMSANNSAITVGRDSDVIIKGGSIVKGSNVTTATINNSGNLTFDDMDAITGVSVTTSTGTVNTTSSTVTLSSTPSNQTYVERDGTSSSATIYTATSGTIVLTYDSYGAASVKELATGATFTVQNGATTVTYTKAAGGIEARLNGVLKIYRESKTTVPMTELAFTGDDSKLVEAVIMDSDNANLTFQASTTGKITAGDDAFDIVSYYDYTSSGTFGTVKKNSDGTFDLTINTSAATTWTSVTISDGSTVNFASDFTGMTIIVADGTTFTSTGGTSFTVSSDNSDYVSIYGADSSNVSLSTGTIQTADYTQTIAAGKYSVGGYSDGTDGSFRARIHLSATLTTANRSTSTAQSTPSANSA